MTNDPQTHWATPKPIHVSFHEQAARTPDALCLIDPHAVVVQQSEQQRLTYQQVQTRVLQLAVELKRLGAGRNKIVALFLEPSADMVVSMLAVLSSGAAFLGLDLGYPVSMLQRVLRDAQPVAVLTTKELRGLLPSTPENAAVLALDDAAHRPQLQQALSSGGGGGGSSTFLEDLLQQYHQWPSVDPEDLCFVNYSSGTTGQPKGIAHPHRAPALCYQWRFQEIVDYGPGDVIALNVFFIWEAVRPLMRGGAVIPVPSSVIYDAQGLANFLNEYPVTEMLFTPSLLENLLNLVPETDLRRKLAGTKLIFLSGEVVSMALRDRCCRILPHVRFFNLYGVSECHEVGAVNMRHDVDPFLSPKFCPCGVPSGGPTYILDEEGARPVSPGGAGELYVGGRMLAKGYLNLPELTKSRFVPNPFRPGELMYRTGDRARMLPNGHLEILGRCDFMVKIRGYSVVLGAVEAAMKETVALKSCVVIADGEEGEEKHLVAYIVRADHEEGLEETRLTNFSIDPRTGKCAEIRHAVDGALPHYMVPSVFIEVESLPVAATGNAKLDRRALEAQSKDRRAMLRSLQFADTQVASNFSVASREAAVPAGRERWKRMAKNLRVPVDSQIEDVEDAMATLWEMVLGRDLGTMTPDADFHENGGHSLNSARLVSLINKCFGSKLTAVSVMRGTTTIRSCCAEVMESWATRRPVSPPVSTADSSDSSNGDFVIIKREKSPTEEDKKILQQVREDAKLPKDVVPKTRGSVRGLDGSKTVLLTGATGFLGAHVLAELLRKYPSASVMCLQRSPNRDAIQKNLKGYSLWDDGFAPRIDVRKGDLSKPGLGLDQATLHHMSSVVDAIVHCGAAVSMTAPYSMLKNANVNGTLEIIRLACSCREGTPLVYVSSSGIFPRDKGVDEVFMENSDPENLPERLGADDGYGLSKWAAEQLVLSASKRGLPAMTVRYGNIGWQKQTGIGNPFDFQGMVINGCRQIGCRPRIQGWQFEITPVDFAAGSLVALSGKPDTLAAGSIFNCVQSEYIDAERVFEFIADVDGAPIPSLSYGKWVNKVLEVSDDDKNLAPFKALIMGIPDGEEFFSKIAYLDCTRLDAAVADLGTPSMARLSSSEVSQYFRTFLLAN